MADRKETVRRWFVRRSIRGDGLSYRGFVVLCFEEAATGGEKYERLVGKEAVAVKLWCLERRLCRCAEE